jgi:CRP/FNR family transcriptional regulator, cyclic AMP receptor protein
MDLRSVGLLAGLPDRDLDKITQQVREVRHPAGAEITVQGREGVGFLMILEGQVEVRTPDGRRRKLGPGDHFGEMALLDQRPRSATVRTKTAVTALRLSAAPFRKLLANEPTIALALLRTLSARVRELEQSL